MTTRPFTALCGIAIATIQIAFAADQPPPHLVILQYHHVSTDTPASTSISPARFTEHMDWLADNGFRVTSLPEAIATLQQGGELPDKTVAITFDDGYRSIYTTAYPELRQRGWPFTIFVNPEPHDSGKASWASWEELREMGDNNATIANHTMSHLFMLRQKSGESDEAWLNRLRSEVVNAEQRILEETGQSHKLLAYPYGESNTAIQALIEDLGFVGFGQQSGPVGTDSDYADLPRFPLAGVYSAMDSFKTKMRSLPMPVEGVSVDSRSGNGTLFHDESQPTLELTLSEKQPVVLNCFASGQGAIDVERAGAGRYVIRAPEPLPVGRSRYNCTYASPWKGRFYWFSQAWVRRDEGDVWTHQ